MPRSVIYGSGPSTGKQVTLGNDNPRYTAESGIAINEVVTLGRVVGVFKRV